MTNKPVIRLATEADSQAIAAIYAPFCIETAISFEEVPPSPEEMARRIRTSTETLPWLVLEDGETAGYVYARPFRERAAYRWSVEVTVYVHPSYRRRGVARALYTALFRILTLQGYYKSYAGITIPNPASERLHEEIGFVSVGVYHGVGYKLGAWHDVRFYEMPLQPEQPVPIPPKAVRALVDTPAWESALEMGLLSYRARGIGPIKGSGE
jgi:phosphinothricin acetyltransferase